MTKRKSKQPRQLEDVDGANIPLVCENPRCGKEFFKTGAWLKKHPLLVCPHCGFASPLDDDKRLRLFADYIQNARDMFSRMRSDSMR
jgi:hypothetical protein